MGNAYSKPQDQDLLDYKDVKTENNTTFSSVPKNNGSLDPQSLTNYDNKNAKICEIVEKAQATECESDTVGVVEIPEVPEIIANQVELQVKNNAKSDKNLEIKNYVDQSENEKNIKDTKSEEILNKNMAVNEPIIDIKVSRARFFNDLLLSGGGETIEEVWPDDSGGKEAVTKKEPVNVETVSVAGTMLSLSSISPIETFSTLKVEEESPERLEKKKKNVHWADSYEGRTLAIFQEESDESENDVLTDESSDEDIDVECEEEEEEVDSEEESLEIINETQSIISETEDKTKNEKLSENESSDTESESNEDSDDNSQQENKLEVEENEESEEDENTIIQLSPELKEMYEKMTELQKDLIMKASSLERAQAELEKAYNEAEINESKYQRIEIELDEEKKKNSQLLLKLSEEGMTNADRERLLKAESRIYELENRLSKLKVEKQNLDESYEKLEIDRDREIEIVQKALEKALNEQSESDAKYQKVFEQLRTVNSGREQQMLDDFEWKLREVEKLGKKKLSEAIAEKDKKIDEITSELAGLRACEIELKQLKVSNTEQKRNFRAINRKYEELQVSEKILQEEVNRLRTVLEKEKAALLSLQTLHKEEVAEKDRKLLFKLEVQRNQLNTDWEEKVKKECSKLKDELEKNFREERITAIDTTKRLKDREIANLRTNFEKKIQDLKTEIEGYKERLKVKEGKHRIEIERAQTNTDMELIEMRRKIDKLDMSYQEKIEKMQESHDVELSSIKEEYENKIAQCESTLQQQLGTTRTTLELVKQSMKEENQKVIEEIQRQHNRALAEQWEKLEREKEKELEDMENIHRKVLEGLEKQMEESKKRHGRAEAVGNHGDQKRNELVLVTEPGLQIAASPFSARLEPEGGPSELKNETKEKVLKDESEKILQLTKQLNEGKMEIEYLKQRLAEKEKEKGNENQKQPNPPQRHHHRRSKKSRGK